MRIGLAFAALALALPAQAQVYSDPYGQMQLPETVVLSLKVGGQTTASAGDVILSTFRYRTARGARLLDQIIPWGSFPEASIIKAGDEVYSVETSRAFKACSVKITELGWPACLIDDDGDGTFDRLAKNDVAGAKPLQAKARYERVPEVQLPAITSGFERKLIYQGAGNGGLQFLYREFSNDLARPAFEEQLSIPLSGALPQQFAIKGLIFTAIKVDGLGLTVRLDSVDTAKGWPAG